MDVLNILNASGRGSGAMSAFNSSRADREAERAEAVRTGKSASYSPDQLEKKVREVAEDFVSVFMNQITKSMRSTVQENPEMHGDNGEKFFQDMLDSEYSKSMAKGSGYGLTDLIYESMMSSYRVREAPAAGETALSADSLNRTMEAADQLAAEAMM